MYRPRKPVAPVIAIRMAFTLRCQCLISCRHGRVEPATDSSAPAKPLAGPRAPSVVWYLRTVRTSLAMRSPEPAGVSCHVHEGGRVIVSLDREEGRIASWRPAFGQAWLPAAGCFVGILFANHPMLFS